MIKKVKGSEFNEARKADVAVVDFSAAWCGPCKMLGPVIEELSEEMAGKADFYNVDVDEDNSLAAEFGVSSIPFIIVMKKGSVVASQVGFVPKNVLKGFIENNI